MLRGNPARGLRAFQAMQRNYYLLGSGLYKGEPFSYLWPFSQGLAATVSMSNVPAIKKIPSLRQMLARELKARLVGLHAYYDTSNSGEPEGTFTSTLPAFDGTVAPPAGPGGAKYYDDNDWVGIELMRIYRMTREPAAARGGRSAHGVRDGRLAGRPDPRLPRRHPLLEPRPKTPTATRSRPRRRPSSRCSSTA